MNLACRNDLCKNFIEDYFICQGLIPSDWIPPTCEICGTAMYRTYERGGGPSFNLSTSDLPHGFGEGFQPAFQKYCHSKKEAMQELDKLNSKERDKAKEAGLSFNEFEWLGDSVSKKDKEFNEIRTEMGAEVLNKQLSEKHEEVMTKNLETKLEPIWNQLEI